MPFTGHALYDTGVFEGVAEDVSDMIAFLSPFETELLDALSQPENSASNVLHEWLEDALNPNTITTSSGGDNSGTDVAIGVHLAGAAVAKYLQVGMVLKNTTTGEYLQVEAISGNTITASRGFGSTSAATFAAGQSLFIISDAAQEGADVTEDTSRPRVRKSNYCQIFKKDIIVSGTQRAVSHMGVSDEYDHQMNARMKEILRDLEKAAIQGKSSGNTLGSATATRTFSGIWEQITTNGVSIGVTVTADMIDDVIATAYNAGASGEDLSLIVVDPNYKRQIDKLNDSRTEVVQGSAGDRTFQRNVTVFEGSYGVHRVLRSRWMPSNSMLVLDPNKVRVVPLQNRTFQHVPVGLTGDSTKGMVLGEYTVEVRNENGMAKAWG